MTILLDELEKEKGYASAYEAEKWHYHGLAESEGERSDRAEKALEAAQKRVAELEAWNASTNLPGGFSIEEARTLHTNLVSSHISKALSGEKMNKATKEADLRWIHGVLVSAAWFVGASIEVAGIGKGD